METETVPTEKNIPILETAWKRYAQFDIAAQKRSKSHLQMRQWILTLGILAALFAILSQMFPAGKFGLLGFILRVFLILTPLFASLFAWIANKNFAGGDWLIKRAGAEEVLKEIYLFRTVFQKSPTRRQDMEARLAKIQRQVYRSLGGELTMDSYAGPLPSNYHPDNPSSDPGFHDLTGEDYFKYRLKKQRDWHAGKLSKYQTERTRLQWYIGLAGVVGSLLAALSDVTAIWVALAASITAAFIGWQQLRNLDAILRNFSKVILELEILENHWTNLEPGERTDAEFYKMVKSTEDILWSQNAEYIKSQQEALRDSSLEEQAGMINRVIQKAEDADASAKKEMAETLEAFVVEGIDKGEAALTETFDTVLHSLAEEASSEIVQAELAAMGEAIQDAAEQLVERATANLSSSLQAIAAEFEGVEIGRDTPSSVLNQIMSRYPKSNEVKG